MTGGTNKDCAGKRHYPTKARALRGVRALHRENRGHPDSRGRLSAYECECGLYCVGRRYEGAPEHRRTAALDPADFGEGAKLWEKAETLAKERFPGGANATQLAQVLREVLAAHRQAAA